MHVFRTTRRAVGAVLFTLAALAAAPPAARAQATYLGQFGTTGTGNGQFTSPRGISISGNTLYVTDSGNNRVQFFNIAATPEPSQAAVFGLGALGLRGLGLRARRRV